MKGLVDHRLPLIVAARATPRLGVAHPGHGVAGKPLLGQGVAHRPPHGLDEVAIGHLKYLIFFSFIFDRIKCCCVFVFTISLG